MANSLALKNSEWLNALEHDDPQPVRTFVDSLNRAERYLALAQVLGHPRKPTAVLDTLLDMKITDGLVVSSWLLHLSNEKLDLDWTDGLRWLGTRMNRALLGEQVAHAWGKLLERAAISNSCERLLVGIAENYPEVVRQAAAGPAATRLFFMSVNHPHGMWLERAGVSLVDVLRAGMDEDWRLETVMNPAQLGQPTAFDVWKAQDPGREEAHQQLLHAELGALEREGEWIKTWMPTPQWHGSALKAWCDNVISQAGNTLEDPHDDPVLFGPGLTEGADALRVMRQYENLGMGGQMNRTSVRMGHNLVRELRGNRYRLGMFPLIPLAVGLNSSAKWASEAMVCEAYLDQAGTVLEDPRAQYVLQGWSGQEVAGWMIDQPYWQTWRNSRNESLLDVWVASQHEIRKQARLPRAKIAVLARRCPDVLNNVDQQGLRLIQRLDIDDSARSEAQKIMLERLNKAAGATKKTQSRPANRL